MFASWKTISSSVSVSAGIVRADLRAEPVLQRRDDPAAVGVVLGVRGRHEHDVEGQPAP